MYEIKGNILTQWIPLDTLMDSNGINRTKQEIAREMGINIPCIFETVLSLISVTLLLPKLNGSLCFNSNGLCRFSTLINLQLI